MQSLFVWNLLYLVLILGTLIATYYSISFIKNLSFKFNILDKPNERKKHKQAIPRIGGLGIYLISSISLIFFRFFDFPFFIHNQILDIYLIFSSSFFLLGFLDDLFNLSPFLRLFTQFLITYFLLNNGFIVESISFKSLLGNYFSIELNSFCSYIFSLIWVVAIINSINWLDGIDGLVASLSLVLNLVFIIKFFVSGNILMVILSAIIFASCLGFYFHNKYPSSVFLGDGGSYFIGFNIVFLSLISFSNNINQIQFPLQIINFNLIACLFLLFIPIFDMIRVITLRLLDFKSPFFPDRNHIHHKLIDSGLTDSQAVKTITLLNLFFGSLVIFIF